MRSVTNLMIAMSIHLADVCLSFSLVAQIYIYIRTKEEKKQVNHVLTNKTILKISLPRRSPLV